MTGECAQAGPDLQVGVKKELLKLRKNLRAQIGAFIDQLMSGPLDELHLSAGQGALQLFEVVAPGHCLIVGALHNKDRLG